MAKVVGCDWYCVGAGAGYSKWVGDGDGDPNGDGNPSAYAAQLLWGKKTGATGWIWSRACTDELCAWKEALFWSGGMDCGFGLGLVLVMVIQVLYRATLCVCVWKMCWGDEMVVIGVRDPRDSPSSIVEERTRAA